MARIGTVVETNGEFATIASSKRGICEGCSERAGCALEAGSEASLSEIIRARNPIDARPGDLVEFALAGHAELGVSLLVWIVPLIGLIAGAVLGASFHHLLWLERDIATLIGTVVGAGLAFGVVIAVDRWAKHDARLVPVIVKVVSPKACSLSVEIDGPRAD